MDWQVIVRLAAHCRRRYKRECGCRVPTTVMTPGPPKAIGKGLLSNNAAGKQVTGADGACNRVPEAVERTVPFAFLIQSLMICWYAVSCDLAVRGSG